MQMYKIVFFILGASLALGCGRTDFDHNYVPDAGTDGSTDSDVIADVEGCGNGLLETSLGEECDNGTANADTPNAACRTDCTLASCGDTIIDTLREQCDDGDLNSNEPGAACRTDCIMAGCGDGILDPGEECDEGGLNSDAPGSVCRTNCQNPRCGDLIVDPATEECDDGNNIDTDACTNACTQSVCGDGIVRAGVEVCDDGDTVDDIYCSKDCLHACGDGVLEPERGEMCDDGTLNSDLLPLACRENCIAAGCGDGVWDPGQFCLATGEFLYTGQQGKEAISADLNGDGRKDVVLLSTTAIHTFIQTDGGFTLSWSSGGLVAPVSPLVADLNNDTIPDLIVVESTARRVAVFMGVGGTQPTFGSPVRHLLGATNSASAAVAGEFSGDTLTDIAVLIPYSNQMRLMVNNGAGGFTVTTQATCQRPVSVAKGYLNAQASTGQDIAVACYAQDMLEIFKNNGDGTFTPSFHSAATNPVDVKLADINKDGRGDAVVLKAMQSPGSPEFVVYFQNSSGGFTPGAPKTGLPLNSEWLQIADADRDGDDDILVSSYSGLNRFLNDGTGQFSADLVFGCDDYPGKVLWQDLTQDMIADLFIPGGTTEGFITSTSSISLPFPTDNALPATGLRGTITDRTGDGFKDAVILSSDDRVMVASGNGNGQFTSVTTFPAQGAVDIGVIGDPLATDLVLVTSGFAHIMANSQGVMSSIVSILTPMQPVAVLGSLHTNADAYLDSAILYKDAAILLLIEGGSNPVQHTIPIGTSPDLLAAGHLNADTTLDFLIIDGNGTSVLSLLNGGSGTFSAGFIGGLTTANPDAIALMDMDGDGVDELVAAHTASGVLEVYSLDLADPSISHMATLDLACGPQALMVTDHDNNGEQDLMVVCDDGHRLRWLSPALGALTLNQVERLNLTPFNACIAGDLNDDGVHDLLCITDDGNTNTLLTTP